MADGHAMPKSVAKLSRELQKSKFKGGCSLGEFRGLVSDLGCDENEHFVIMSGFLIYDKKQNKVFHTKWTQISNTQSTRLLVEKTMMS